MNKNNQTPKASPFSENTAEGFLGSVAKYSIATVINIVIMALSIIVTGLFIPDSVYGEISIFTNWTNTLMAVAILGMDKALIRFYNKPPAGLKQHGLFRVCFYFSSAILIFAGALLSTFLQKPIYTALGFSTAGHFLVPLLFLNVFFYMIARYFNVLYRMEGNIFIYTLESILMQFFLRLFYILGFFVFPKNPINAMAICSVLGFGGFALVFSFLRRSVLRPSRAEFKSGAYKTLVPYGLSIAPASVLIMANLSIPLSYIAKTSGGEGIYSFVITLSGTVAIVQAGFSTFWGPYMFANYKTQSEKIKRVHEYLNLVVLLFFCLLVAFKNIAFLIFHKYAEGLNIFSLTMLGALFTILCETTVYGNEIAKKPVFDTIGIAIALLLNIGLCVLLVPRFALYGAAIAYAVSNFSMFIFRTLTAQKFYRSINSYGKTAFAVLLAVLLAVLGTVFAQRFLIKLLCSVICALIYCLMYNNELKRLLNLGSSFMLKLFKKDKK